MIFPVHPRTRRAIESNDLWNERKGNLRMIPPVGYLDMVMLERHARLIVTDSGGVQKEAFFYRVPCVTLREETEWVELLELGWNYLVSPTSAVAVYDGIMARLNVRGQDAELYGGGRAAWRIVQILQEAVRV